MRIDVLDHGFVRLVECWGHGDDGGRSIGPDDCEVGIIEAARQSTQGSFRGWDEDEKLLRYLYKNNHATPFEFAGMVIEVQAPIFVFREWHRHRTQSYNEMSARYAPLPDLAYVPTIERIMLDGGKNKQAGAVKGSAELTEATALTFRDELDATYRAAEDIYQTYLGLGIPKELARCLLPVGRYSKMRASANLRNWLGFMTLRADPNAQWEIQQFAFAVGKILEDRFPRTFQLWKDGKFPQVEVRDV